MSDELSAKKNPEEDCQVDLQNVRAERWLGGARLAASLIAMVAAPVVLGKLASPGYGGLGFLAALVAFLWSSSALAGAIRGPGERRFKPGTVSLADAALVVRSGGDVATLPLSKVTGGWVEKARRVPGLSAGGFTTNDVEPGQEQTIDIDHVAVLTFADGRVLAVTRPSEEAATAFLDRARAGVASRAVRMAGYREDASGRKIAGFFAALFGLIFFPLLLGVIAGWVGTALSQPITLRLVLGMAGAGLIGTVPFGLVFLWMWRKIWPTWIEIGADGVVLQSAFRKRFIPHASIVEAKPKTTLGVGLSRDVELVLTNGRKRYFPVGSGAEAIAVCDRIRAAKANANGGDAPRLATALERAGRPLPEWRRALQSVVADSGYRSAGHDIEAVMRVVEDVGAPLEQRIAAALAALPAGGDEARKRIRIAAEACVEPRVRVALTRASAGEIDDDELEDIAPREARAG